MNIENQLMQEYSQVTKNYLSGTFKMQDYKDYCNLLYKKLLSYSIDINQFIVKSTKIKL